MDHNTIINKLEEGLKIPVGDFHYYGSSISVISGRHDIGEIPFYNVNGILTFDFSEGALHWLKWNLVYEENKTAINHAIDELFGKDKFTITLSTFRKLYLKESELI